MPPLSVKRKRDVFLTSQLLFKTDEDNKINPSSWQNLDMVVASSNNSSDVAVEPKKKKMRIQENQKRISLVQVERVSRDSHQSDSMDIKEEMQSCQADSSNNVGNRNLDLVTVNKTQEVKIDETISLDASNCDFPIKKVKNEFTTKLSQTPKSEKTYDQKEIISSPGSDTKLSPIRSREKYNKETILAACEQLKQGEPLTSIAKKIGGNCAPSTVRRWQQKYMPDSSSKRKYHRKVTDSKIIETCILLNEGGLVKDLASRVGVCEATVRRWKKKFATENEFEPAKPSEVTSKRSSELFYDSNCMQFWQYDPLVEYRERALELPQSTLEQMSKDVKLRSEPIVALTRDRKVEKLCSRLIEDSLMKVLKESLKRCNNNKRRQSLKRKKFVPTRKVYFPKELKLQVVKMIDKGISALKLARVLKVNELIINSWVSNRDLLNWDSQDNKDSTNGVSSSFEQVLIKVEPDEVANSPEQKYNEEYQRLVKTLDNMDQLLVSWYLKEKSCGEVATSDKVFQQAISILAELNETQYSVYLDWNWYLNWEDKCNSNSLK